MDNGCGSGKAMRLSNEAIQEFKAICREEFGVNLSDGEAEQHALRVLTLFWLTLTDDEPESGSDFDTLRTDPVS